MESVQSLCRPVYWIDECGVDHRLYREYGRSPRGERIYQTVSGSRRGRTSIISAYDGEKLVAPILFEGSCDTYSPDLNPIEHKWPQLKTITKKDLPYTDNKVNLIASKVLMLC